MWGHTTWNRGATAYTPLRFPGQYFDPEPGLHYNVFRTYDPGSARYLTPDPLASPRRPTPRRMCTIRSPGPTAWVSRPTNAPSPCTGSRRGIRSASASMWTRTATSPSAATISSMSI
uniref:RHS repeat-associated core domain-containing protein n=1 Tax=Streptomyces minutiscleroticus TaxID=68238 RepID=UPI003570CBB6